MSAEEYLSAGKPREAISALQGEVRKNPSSAELRTFLFQLLAVLGEWDRSLTQLNVVGELDASRLPMVQTYRSLIQCEVRRSKVFAGQQNPLFFGEPEPWMGWMAEALKLIACEKYEDAARYRAQAFEEAAVSPGAVEGTPFSWIADSDPRLGPLLEVVISGEYYWVPFFRIKQLSVSAPEDLRDLVWIPAAFTWTNGGDSVGFIPVRYPASETSEDEAVQLSRKTVWREPAPDTFLGLGQRVLSTDQADHPLLELRELAFADQSDSADG